VQAALLPESPPGLGRDDVHRLTGAGDGAPKRYSASSGGRSWTCSPPVGRKLTLRSQRPADLCTAQLPRRGVNGSRSTAARSLQMSG